MSKRIHPALLALVIAPFAWGQGDPMTLEDVASLKSVSSVRMSPNGDRIAYLQTVQREVYVEDDGPAYQELHVVDLAGNSIPYVTGKVNVGSVAWAPDGQSIYFVSKRDAAAKFNSIWNIPLAKIDRHSVMPNSAEK